MVLTGDELNFLPQINELKGAKNDILNLLGLMESGRRADESACSTVTEIASHLEHITRLIKKSPRLSQISEVRNILRDVVDFSDSLSAVVRSRSWHEICKAFSPNDTLETLKGLKSILTRADKKAKKDERSSSKSTTSSAPEPIRETSGLIDDRSFNAYKNRVQLNKDRPTTEEEQFLIDRDLKINGANMTVSEKRVRSEILKRELRMNESRALGVRR